MAVPWSAAHQPGTERYVGVFHTPGQDGQCQWRARLSRGYRYVWRWADTPEEAAHAYDDLVRSHGMIGKRQLNFPRPEEAVLQAAVVSEPSKSSRYVGVSRASRGSGCAARPWAVFVEVGGKRICSNHATEEEAARAYDAFVRGHGLADQRWLNFPRPDEAAAQAAGSLPRKVPQRQKSEPEPAAAGGSARAEPPATAARSAACAAERSVVGGNRRRGRPPGDRSSRSGFIAVYPSNYCDGGTGRWYSTFMHLGVKLHTELFDDKEDAALAYDELVRRHDLVAERLLNFPLPDEATAQAEAALVARGVKAGGKRPREEAPTEETEGGTVQEAHAPPRAPRNGGADGSSAMEYDDYAPLLAQLVEPATTSQPYNIAELAAERDACEHMRAELERTHARLRLVEQAVDPSRLRVLRLAMQLPPETPTLGGGVRWDHVLGRSERCAALQYLSELEAATRATATGRH